ncbi:hypothetical protein ACWT_1779 [Actinoplanes sp. SE50]|uniref:hypothetical protein n=1 Tax=unclassified Actinoplanes TaxID=2626549 RepID=UPI00023ED3CB|nr:MULTISPECIES: hypothetical protein [unclassified Actinoplanes]AEV82798.1 hypothetical protein ACPL_1901 [Actinoplanes sp. SE50/110]ATO81194.1 hypothetical protein ACWT_1779 [Actinoplanes sp. SE50]SLL98601.1 hypothetical protein ACSP50_1828 [Actinoplanes sp. SE50/110]
MNDDEPVELRPILRDLRVASPMRVTVAETTGRGSGGAAASGQPEFWLRVAGASGLVGHVPHPADPLYQRVATAADQLHDWLLECLPELGLPAVWPECPEHPATHPLTVGIADDVPVWKCPRTGTVHAELGAL